MPLPAFSASKSGLSLQSLRYDSSFDSSLHVNLASPLARHDRVCSHGHPFWIQCLLSRRERSGCFGQRFLYLYISFIAYFDTGCHARSMCGQPATGHRGDACCHHEDRHWQALHSIPERVEGKGIFITFTQATLLTTVYRLLIL